MFVCTAMCTCLSFTVCVTLDVVRCILRFAALVTDVPSFLSCLCGLMCSTAVLSRPALPLPDPPLALAQLPLAQPDPPQPLLTLTSLARLCSAHSNRTRLSRAALTEGRMGRLNLGAGRYMSPNCYFIKLTVIMKKPFLFPCFPSLTFSPPPPLHPPPCLSP